jgi:outer membrane biosynthesis protein TonB
VATIAHAQERVDLKVARAQVVKKVDPVWPAEAAAAKIGGLVVADVTIGAHGRVTAVTILSGPVPLHAAAMAH